MKEEINSSSEMKFADELVSKGDKAFLSYTWKLNKKFDDSFDSSEINPYSDDNWANDITYPEHDLEMAFDYYQQALARYQKVLAPDHIKIGEVLYKCGRVSMDPMYDDDIPLSFFERALPIYLKEKPHSRDLAVLYEDLGSVCFAMNKLPSSLDYYNKSLILYYDLAICGEEVDLLELKERISAAELKLDLHIINEGDKYGCADKEGNVVIPCLWKEVSDFSEGLAVVKDDKDFFGYINYFGELVIPCVFRDASLFKEGWTFVEEDNHFDTGEPIDGIRSVIDTDGDVVGNDLWTRIWDLKQSYKALRAAKASKYEEAVSLILPVAEKSGMDTKPIADLIDYYLALKQYEDVAKWCKIAIKRNDYNERHECYYSKLLGFLYQKGLGVESNLLEAFRYYHNAFSYSDDKEADELFDNLLNEHPELKELPEVQNALAPYDDDEEF